MRRLVVALAAILFALPACAACDGRDLRPTLTDTERAELDAALDGRPYATGNHWIATRGAAVVHLVGTMHLSDPRLDPAADLLRPVIEDASLLLLEMTPEGQAALQSRMAVDPGLLILEEAALPELMPEADWQRLAAAASARGIPAVMAAKFQPWFLAMTLAIPACAMDGMTEPEGLDARLTEIAQASGTPLAALEPWDTIFAAFAAAPLPEQVDMLRANLLPEEDSADLFATLLASYFEERSAEGWEVSRLLARRAGSEDPAAEDAIYTRMERALLTGRNRAWLPVILDAAGPEPIVVAAGAAHLQGEEGLARLLEAEGFTLTRAPFLPE